MVKFIRLRRRPRACLGMNAISLLLRRDVAHGNIRRTDLAAAKRAKAGFKGPRVYPWGSILFLPLLLVINILYADSQLLQDIDFIFKISSRRTYYKTNEPIIVILKIQNTSKKTIHFPKNKLWTQMSLAEVGKDPKVIITEGVANHLQDYFPMKPDMVIVRKMNLNKTVFGNIEPGKWQFQIKEAYVSQDPQGWDGTLESNIFNFQVFEEERVG